MPNSASYKFLIVQNTTFMNMKIVRDAKKEPTRDGETQKPTESNPTELSNSPNE